MLELHTISFQTNQTDKKPDELVALIQNAGGSVYYNGLWPVRATRELTLVIVGITSTEQLVAFIDAVGLTATLYYYNEVPLMESDSMV